jgi:hypothetical protein
MIAIESCILKRERETTESLLKLGIALQHAVSYSSVTMGEFYLDMLYVVRHNEDGESPRMV